MMLDMTCILFTGENKANLERFDGWENVWVYSDMSVTKAYDVNS